MADFKEYHRSYARISPLRADFIEKTGNSIPGLPEEDLAEKNKDGSPRYIRVNQENYPKAYRALQYVVEKIRNQNPEANIQEPALYIDTETTLGYALDKHYTLCMGRHVYESCSEEQLRAGLAHETKHLFQLGPKEGTVITKDVRPQILDNEDDADWATVTITDYNTALSCVRKMPEVLIRKHIKNPNLQNIAIKLSNKIPDSFYENLNIAIEPSHLFNPLHPSIGQRLKNMKAIEQEEKPQNELIIS